MFWTRLISGVILLILAVLTVSWGGALLFAVVSLISLIGMYELYRVMDIHKALPGAVGYGAALAYFALVWFQREELLVLVAIAALMLLMAVYVFTFPKYRTDQVTIAFFGLFYVAVMMSFLYKTRIMADGAYLVWLIFLSSWGCDTCAYATGMLFGKHKLAPVLSPKKSIEGAIGGVVGAMLLAAIYVYFFGQHMTQVENPGLACIAACAISAVISQIGDLAASAIKRNHGIKDYGRLIPGHGGILDRFDSVLFTAPAIYFAVTFLR